MLAIIIPTLGNRINELKRLLDSLEVQTNKLFTVICVVQDNHEVIQAILGLYSFPIRMCVSEKKGLSVARNLALKHIEKNSTHITFSDDDCWYPNDMVERVLSYNLTNRNCICFQIFDPDSQKYYKEYPEKSIENISRRESLKVSSIEIFVPHSIVADKLQFDENFGLGTMNPSGEENIFLFDLIRKKYIINYIPEIIVFHALPNWTRKEYTFKGKGALFTRLYNKPIGLIMVLIYSIRKYRLFTDFFRQFPGMLREVFK